MMILLEMSFLLYATQQVSGLIWSNSKTWYCYTGSPGIRTKNQSMHISDQPWYILQLQSTTNLLHLGWCYYSPHTPISNSMFSCQAWSCLLVGKISSLNFAMLLTNSLNKQEHGDHVINKKLIKFHIWHMSNSLHAI